MRNILAAALIVAPLSAAHAWDTPTPPPPSPLQQQSQMQSQTFAPRLTTTQLNQLSLNNAVANRAQARAAAQGGAGGLGGSVSTNNTLATSGGSQRFLGAPSVGFAEAGGGSASACGQAGYTLFGFGGGQGGYGGGLFSRHYEDRPCQLFIEQAAAVAHLWCPEAARAWIVHESAEMRDMLGVASLDPTCPAPLPPPPPVIVVPTPVVHHPHPHPKPALITPVPVCPSGEHLKCVPDHLWPVWRNKPEHEPEHEPEHKSWWQH